MNENQKNALLQHQIDSIISRNLNQFLDELKSKLTSTFYAKYLPMIVQEVSVQIDLCSKEED
jgi:hypothetical protein